MDGGAPPGPFWGGGGGGGGVHVSAAWTADQAAVVAASRVIDVDGRPALVCVAPVSTAASAAALEVTLNGQDFTTDVAHYGFVDPPAPVSLSPSCGPTSGGTAVNVSGDALVGGSHLRCSFGGAPPLGGFDGLAGPGGFEGAGERARGIYIYIAGEVYIYIYIAGERARGLLIEANASGFAPSLRCLTPARAPGRANVSLSPNAQQYSSPPVPFVYYAPPVVSHSSPASGPVLGATVVVVHGSGLGTPHAGGQCDVVCRFGHLLVGGLPGSVAGGGRSITCVAPRNIGARGLALPLEP